MTLSKPSQQSVEHVMVVPTLLFHEIGYFQGFSTNTAPYLNTLLDPSYTSYRPRDLVEEDPSFKQLIPYCIFRYQRQVFHYTRGKEQGEGRLHSKRSIGIGGHISSQDGSQSDTPYQEGMMREIREEIHLNTTCQADCIGLINDDLTEVGKVHLGIVHLFNLDAPKVRPREESIIRTGFTSVEELARDRHDFESWSQICLDHLLDEQTPLV